MNLLSRTMLLALVPALFYTSITSAESRTAQIPALIKALADPNVRYGAFVALKNIGAEAIPALQKSLTSGKGDVPVWSAFTLGEMGDIAKPAVGDLKNALASSDDALRVAAAQALGEIGPAAATAVDALAGLLGDDNVAVRNRAATALGQIGPAAKDAAPALIAALSDSQTRNTARQALVGIGPGAVNPLVNALDKDELRFDVSRVLIAIDPQAAKQTGLDKATAADLAGLRLVLFDTTRDPSEHKSAAAALALLEKDGVAVLIEALEQQAISRIAAVAFTDAGPSAVPVLINVLLHEKPEVRAAAADALGHLGPRAGKAALPLVKLLEDQDRNVRYRAVRALHELRQNAKPAVASLGEVILNPRESEPTRQWAIKTLIVTLPDTHDAVVKILITASKDKVNYGVRQLALTKVREIDLKAAEKAGVK